MSYSSDLIVYLYMYTTLIQLTHKQLQTHGYTMSTVAADVLVLKHQAISTHSAD